MTEIDSMGDIREVLDETKTEAVNTAVSKYGEEAEAPASETAATYEYFLISAVNEVEYSLKKQFYLGLSLGAILGFIVMSLF